MLAACLLELRRHPGRPAAGDRRDDPRAGAAHPCCSTPARTPTRDPRTSSSSRTWEPSSPRRSSASRGRESGCSRSARSRRRGTSSTLRGARAPRRERPQLRRQHRGPGPPDGRRPTSSSPTASRATSPSSCSRARSRACSRALREEITATALGKLGGLLIRPAARRLRERLDPDTYGGAYLLGLRGLAVIAHGNSSRRAITNAIRLAARGVENDVVGRLD